MENITTTGKTTLTFRILPDEKLRLAAKAQELGMTLAQFVEALVLKRYQAFIMEQEKPVVSNYLFL